MMKKYLLFVFFLLLLSVIVNSETILEYNETDYVNVRPTAQDPDDDRLTYFFNWPLSTKGTWQTDYGDAGIYHTKVTVSDGRMLTSENITLIINRKEESPEIEILAPGNKDLFIEEGKSIFFNINAYDLNNDDLNITWLVDGEEKAYGNYYTYKTDYYSEGDHLVIVTVSVGLSTISYKWSVEVADFDRTQLLDSFISLVANETDMIEFELPFFELYDLQYNISEPLGIDGKWQTTYDDAGLYTVMIKIWDDQSFVERKSIKILVENVDRPADALVTSNYWVSEEELLQLYLNYTDPDGDEVKVEVGNLPEGAIYRKDTIFWQPGYDVVTKDTILDEVARNFHLMSRQFVINVNASSNLFIVQQDIKVRVFNTNRPPVLLDVQDVAVNEGDTIYYNLSAYDPDNDTLSFSFEGFSNGHKTRYDEAGTYSVKAIVSDGFLTDEMYTTVKVLDSNQPPSLRPISSVSTEEGKKIEIALEATDPNDDLLTYSVDYLPKGAYFKDNVFAWQPDYDFVQGYDIGEIELTFIVDDGQYNSTKKAKISVENVNIPLLLTSSAQVDGKEFYTDEGITFYVDIFDPDNDDIAYTWQTSMFNTFEGNNSLVVKYDKPGKKKVSVTASDGSQKVKREWQVVVKERPKFKIKYLTS
jgi:hypothetical protein